MISRNWTGCTIAVSFSIAFKLLHFWHLKEKRVIHTHWTHPGTRERDANVFGEVNFVKNTINNGIARKSMGLLQKPCYAAEFSVQYHLTLGKNQLHSAADFCSSLGWLFKTCASAQSLLGFFPSIIAQLLLRHCTEMSIFAVAIVPSPLPWNLWDCRC